MKEFANVKAVEPKFLSTRNACKLCSPLGASLVFRGIKNAMSFIHGGQGCATYIRRYLISHFREPMDIASSHFSENATIFGGEKNLIAGLENVIRQYNPDFIGVSTSCLAETIGEDLNLILNKFYKDHAGESLPVIIPVSTPSYRGTHMNGFNMAVKKIVEKVACKGEKENIINIFPGFVSPADIRHIKEICADFGIKAVILPDYSETLDAPIWDDYKKISEGGTTIDEIKKSGSALASIQLSVTNSADESAAVYLEKEFGVKAYSIPMPVGINQTDRFLSILSEITGKDVPEKYTLERNRLVDAYIDGHKYMSGKKAVVYGEEDLVIAMANFLSETGIVPALCVSGGKSGLMKNYIKKEIEDEDIEIRDGTDFAEIAEAAPRINPDIFIGSSKSYRIARELEKPLVRVGFPIHDRMGGQRILHIGYRGAGQLFDQVINTLLEYKQAKSPVGYGYL